MTNNSAADNQIFFSNDLCGIQSFFCHNRSAGNNSESFRHRTFYNYITRKRNMPCRISYISFNHQYFINRKNSIIVDQASVNIRDDFCIFGPRIFITGNSLHIQSFSLNNFTMNVFTVLPFDSFF